MQVLLIVVLTLFLSGCSSQRPVLYPNEQFKRAGSETVDREVDECMQRADEYLTSGGTSAASAAKGTATSATVGAAAGGAGGAVLGHAGRGAAAGAAGGAAAGATRGLIESMWGRRGPSPAYKNFVFRCLREKGYSPIGWD